MRSAMDLFDFEKSANLKHPNVHSIFLVSSEHGSALKPPDVMGLIQG